MSYEQFYHLREQPFSNTPDPRFYFDFAEHSQILARLRHVVDTMKGLAVVIGDVGTGKTTLARKMLEALDDSLYESALLVIIHSSVSPEWLLRKIALQLGIADVAVEKVDILSQVYQRLIEFHQKGKKVVVLIDEANMLNRKEIMEEFRGFLNLEVPGSKLITFIFFGLPELEKNLNLDEPLAQRVALKCRLSSFTPEVTRAYVRHRLKVAGSEGNFFSDAVLDEVHRHAHGIPRLVNTLCDNILLEGYLRKKTTIDVRLVTDVAQDLGLAPSAS